MVLKRLKLPKSFKARTCSYTQAYGCRKKGRNLKISAKMLFSISIGKKQISPLLAPRRKTFAKIY